MTEKVICKACYQYAYPLGRAKEEPRLVPAPIEDKNGHILPYVRFEGGSLTLNDEALQVLDRASSRGEQCQVRRIPQNCPEMAPKERL